MKKLLPLLLLLPSLARAQITGGTPGSESGNLTTETARATAAENLRVLKAGDTMTGQLTNTSTITVQGNAFSVGVSTFVVTGGNVGIGTTAPLLPLEADSAVSAMPATSGTAQAGGILRVVSAGGEALDFGTANSAPFYSAWMQAASPSGLNTNRTLLINPNGGNVGIGGNVAAPATTLDVNGSAQFGSGATKSTFTTTGALTLAAAAPLTVSSATFVGVTVSTQAAGGAGASVTALCKVAGTFALGGGCNCAVVVAATSIISTPNVVTAGGVATGWTCQVAGGTGGQCSAYAICSRLQ